MARNGNHMPKPDAVWVALGIVAFATMLSLPPKRRRVFLDALATLAAQSDSSDRVIAFGARKRWNGTMSQSIRSGVFWLKRLIVELERAVGS